MFTAMKIHIVVFWVATWQEIDVSEVHANSISSLVGILLRKNTASQSRKP
jgi:hypothetical protein